ncbi:amino acid ABC transporter ATP-binding protein [Shumkonia mesophila]|uniref:amino acid ABC transporter ATP-binding protein n=1 Tax=Shumkonia mesophila TaxID=2838854 RepID=UPI002934B346|nr:amino acid ABC transporter ATP-binding protein [Shumkonia mesophila]
MPAVQVKDVKKVFSTLCVLNGVSFTVEEGEVVALIGRSGSGKSTMLRCINGLEHIQEGEIIIGDHRITAQSKDLRALRQDVGMVFQSYNLFPHLTIAENIALAPRVVKKMKKAEIDPLVDASLKRVGLLDKKWSYPDELSGGQQQRVAIARSLAMKPKVILFDEVTSALDPELTGEVLRTVAELAQGGMTMILVTHEMGFAQRVANTTIFMHEGKIWESGPSKEFFASPKTEDLRNFLSASVESGK